MGCVFQNKTATQSMKQKDPPWGCLWSCFAVAGTAPLVLPGSGSCSWAGGANWCQESLGCISSRKYLCRIWPCGSTISRSNSAFTYIKVKLLEGSTPQAQLHVPLHCPGGIVTVVACWAHPFHALICPLPADGEPWCKPC